MPALLFALFRFLSVSRLLRHILAEVLENRRHLRAGGISERHYLIFALHKTGNYRLSEPEKVLTTFVRSAMSILILFWLLVRRRT